MGVILSFLKVVDLAPSSLSANVEMVIILIICMNVFESGGSAWSFL